jgi:hypothetical protein
LTDNTVEISHQLSFGDFIQEFRTGSPGSELFPEPLGHGRVISGFALEGELQENAQDGIERNLNDFCTMDPVWTPTGGPGAVNGFPQGQSCSTAGLQHRVTPIGRHLARRQRRVWLAAFLAASLKNLCGEATAQAGMTPEPVPQPPSPGFLPTFDPGIDTQWRVRPFCPGPADQPGFGKSEQPLLPLPGAVGQQLTWATGQPDELFIGVNTIMKEPIEGFVDAWGPFNPAAVIGEAFNNARQPEMATWPNVNRVNVQGAFKAAPLRNVELTNPYFHDGGNLTLRQQLDFYMRGGNFPLTNKAHRDFLIMNLRLDDEALGGCVLPPVPPSTLGRRAAGPRRHLPCR